MHRNAGVDVSKDHLDWTVGEDQPVQRVTNTKAGIRSVVKQLRKHALERIIVESTGGYERPLVDALETAGLPVILVNPWRVRRFGEGLGVLAKTDPIDARLLAMFGDRARPPRRPLPGARGRQMASYVARRRHLIATIVAEKSRLETADAWMKRQIRDLVRLLERRVEKIDQLLDCAIANDAEKQANRQLLESAPSVGPGIARTLLVDLPELGTLTKRKIASLVGLAPFPRDSGRKRGQRRIRGGRPGPRTALYLGAMNGARFNPVLRALYQRLRAAGKPPKLAFVALARKLLTILNAMVRDQTPWRNANA